MKQYLQLIQGIASIWGGIIITFLGGHDQILQLLFMLIICDLVTGVLLAAFFKKSKHSETGTLNSRVMFTGLAKKVLLLGLVAIAHQIDQTMNLNTVRSTCILFFCGDEGLSILENLGLMGVKYPDFLKRMLDVMKEDGNASD